MMKSDNRYLPFLLTAILAIFSACQKEIILDHHGYTPKIVMNGIISPDSIIEIKVSKSFLYTDTFPDNTLLKDATLTLLINGQEREKMVLSYIDTIREYSGHFNNPVLLSVFRSTIRPKIGDLIRIEASAEGYNTAWAETTIPIPPQINRIDTFTFLTTKNIINTGYSNITHIDYSRIYPKNISEEEQFRNLRLKMAITTGSGASQYFLLRVRAMTEKIDMDKWGFWYFLIYTDDDPVFNESYQNNIIEDVILDGTHIAGRKYSSALLFSNKLFRNNQYTLDFSLTGYYYIHTEYEQKENENGYGWDVYPISTEVFNPPLEVQFTLITPELYPYYRKINEDSDRDENPLLVVSEPEITFSNVHNGIGIVGAESSAKAQIEIPPFPGGENRVPRSY